MKEPASTAQGIARVAAGALCFSTVVLFSRWTRGLEAGTLAFYRALFAFAFFIVLRLWQREPLRWPADRRTGGLLLGLGLAVGLSAALYIYAIQHTTAANAALLINTAAVYVAFLAPWLLHEPPARYRLPGLLLAMLGVICLVGGPTGLDFHAGQASGLVVGVLSGFTFSTTMLFSRALSRRVDSRTQTFWSTAIATLLLAPWGLQTSGPAVLTNLPLLLPLGAVSLGLAYWLYFTGLQSTRTQVVSMVALLEPLGGALIGMLFFQEIPTALSLFGGLCILAGIYLIARNS